MCSIQFFNVGEWRIGFSVRETDTEFAKKCIDRKLVDCKLICREREKWREERDR